PSLHLLQPAHITSSMPLIATTLQDDQGFRSSSEFRGTSRAPTGPRERCMSELGLAFGRRLEVKAELHLRAVRDPRRRVRATVDDSGEHEHAPVDRDEMRARGELEREA